MVVVRERRCLHLWSHFGWRREHKELSPIGAELDPRVAPKHTRYNKVLNKLPVSKPYYPATFRFGDEHLHKPSPKLERQQDFP